jgi:hypothetical protein
MRKKIAISPTITPATTATIRPALITPSFDSWPFDHESRRLGSQGPKGGTATEHPWDNGLAAGPRNVRSEWNIHFPSDDIRRPHLGTRESHVHRNLLTASPQQPPVGDVVATTGDLQRFPPGRGSYT